MRKTWQRLTSDRRRFGLFCGLLFVGLLLWARIIVIARPARTAIAELVIESSRTSVLTSDKVFIPVVLEKEPTKNPFSVNNNAFPFSKSLADNNVDHHLSPHSSSENVFVSSLKLDAVMGDMAMINGTVVQVGGIVGPHNSKNPLRLVKVEGRMVILSAGACRYELSIAPSR